MSLRPPPGTATAPSTRRRRLAGALAAAPALLAGCATPPPRPPRAGDDTQALYRVVNRLSWGASDGELAQAAALGRAGYVRAQLAASAPDALPPAAQAQVDALAIRRRPLAELVADAEALRKSADAAVGEDARKAAQQAYQQELSRLAREAAARHLLRALYSRQQLREQMTWFWFNHFNVHQYKSNLRAMVGDYEEQALRPHALGGLRPMLGAVARHPAMLRYLDNEQNAAGRGNENYARELLELHTLGIDGGYSQRDVQELARVLSGHGLNLGPPDGRPRLGREHEALDERRGLYEFNPARHDFGDKLLLGRTIRGRGAAELDEVLDLLVAHPSTARFVCRKLAVFLLADDPPAPLVGRMAQAFGSGGGIGPALQVLVAAPEFGAAGAKFKDPMRFVVSAARAAYDERVVLNTLPLQNWLNRLGEGLYNRSTPDGYPMTAEAWNGSGQLAARFEVARAIGGGSAGLFKPEDPTQPEQRAFPQLARAAYYQAVQPTLRDQTRLALEGAGSAPEWNALYLASPEFMVR